MPSLCSRPCPLPVNDIYTKRYSKLNVSAVLANRGEDLHYINTASSGLHMYDQRQYIRRMQWSIRLIRLSDLGF